MIIQNKKYEIGEKVFVATFDPHLNEKGYLKSPTYKIEIKTGYVTYNHPENKEVAIGNKEDLYGVRTKSFCVATTEKELKNQLIDYLDNQIKYLKEVNKSHKKLINSLK